MERKARMELVIQKKDSGRAERLHLVVESLEKKLQSEQENVQSLEKPSCVAMSDPAAEVLMTMVKNCFCHLPVTDDNIAVVGVVDIAKCLNNAISKFESSTDKVNNPTGDALKASLVGVVASSGIASAIETLIVSSFQWPIFSYITQRLSWKPINCSKAKF